MKITLHRDGFDLTKLKLSLNSEHSSDKPYLWNLNLIWSKTTLDLKTHWWRWFELTSHQTSWEVLHIHGTRKFFFLQMAGIQKHKRPEFAVCTVNDVNHWRSRFIVEFGKWKRDVKLQMPVFTWHWDSTRHAWVVKHQYFHD